MSDEKIIKEIKVSPPEHVIVVKVSYSLGGMNPFSMREEPRGYWLHVYPETRQDGFRIYSAYSGVKMFLLPVGRKSVKKLQEAVAMVTDDMIRRAMQKCKLPEGVSFNVENAGTA